MRDFKLYFILDVRERMRHAPLDLARRVVAGGADIVQLRYKSATTRQFLELGERLKRVLQPCGVPLIVNDRVDVALALDAAGVHLGQEDDMPPELARRILGPGKIIGLSCHSLSQALEAQAAGADYLAVGPIFATTTKRTVVGPLGTSVLAGLARRIRIPWLAIGGIDRERLGRVLAAGARRVAVVSALGAAPDPLRAARGLKEMLAGEGG